MSESLYFNLLFKKLSNSDGDINYETLNKLSNLYSGSINIIHAYEIWKNNPQVWCLKSGIVKLPNVKINQLEVSQNTENVVLDKENLTVQEDPMMVIHVCDEPKNVKKDFQCSKDLLISEMKYFADYLSSGSQSAADVDISVHCDVNIFEWLIKYVKRDLLPVNERVSLSSMKPNNAISILISSDFLKMDSLVEECIHYIHDNINSILASSFNINCVSGSLISRISDSFSDLDLDSVIDKKDKIKSSLYKKKIERLFDAVSSKKDFTMAPASQLFRCKCCLKILIKGFDKRIICVESRLCINITGSIIYCHVVDDSWNINDQLADWVRQYRSDNKSLTEATVMLYWRLWSHLNCADCETCGQTFPLFEIGHCRYHLEGANFGKDDSKGVIPIVQGIYNCCGVLTLRFDPFRLNKGCKVKDHILKLSTVGIKYSDEEAHLDKILDVLAHHRQLFEVQFVLQDCDRDFISGVMGRDNLINPGKLSDSILKDEDDIDKPENLNDNAARSRLQPLIRHCIKSDVSKKKRKKNIKNMDEIDEELGDSEDLDQDEIDESGLENESSMITIKTGAILLGAPQFPVSNNKKWDNNKSLRYNQDSQRQEDLRRMRQIVNYLISLRINIDKSSNPKLKEFSGGIYCQLEQQWRAESAEKIAAAAAILLPQRSQSNLKIKHKQLGTLQPFK